VQGHVQVWVVRTEEALGARLSIGAEAVGP